MNVIALIGAVVGLAALATTVIFGNKIQNRWLRYLAATTGIIISIVIAGFVPVILGDNNNQTSSQAGEYMVYLAVAFFVLKSIFFRKSIPTSK